MDWKQEYESKLISAEEAAAKVKDGDILWIGPMAVCPMDIVKALDARTEELNGVTCVSGFFLAPFKFLTGAGKGHIGYECMFLGPIERQLAAQGNININSFNFQHIDQLVTDIYKPNVMLTEVSAPDEDGYMSVGPFGAFGTRGCLKVSDLKIVQVNNEAPYVKSTDPETRVHVSQVDFIVAADHPLPEVPFVTPDETEAKIAKNVAALIEDGDTLQIGYGPLANAIMDELKDKKDLGIHTEMISEGVIDLIDAGVVTGAKKELDTGKVVSPLYVGGKRMYDWCASSPVVEQKYQGYVNDLRVISSFDHLAAVNFGIMTDLTGQTASEGVGYVPVSGTGGQMDFAIGAYMSKHGKFIGCFHSTYTDPEGNVCSNIVSALPAGTPVTTPRSVAGYIVTEWGAVRIRDLSIPARVEAIISVAHPDFREQLRKEAEEAGLLH